MPGHKSGFVSGGFRADPDILPTSRHATMAIHQDRGTAITVNDIAPTETFVGRASTGPFHDGSTSKKRG
jgi:hypothetical protein